jgi:hypothetical protein
MEEVLARIGTDATQLPHDLVRHIVAQVEQHQQDFTGGTQVPLGPRPQTALAVRPLLQGVTAALGQDGQDHGKQFSQGHGPQASQSVNPLRRESLKVRKDHATTLPQSVAIVRSI